MSQAATVVVHTPDGHDLTLDPGAKRRPILSADEARALTAAIRDTSTRLWVLVTEAHDRRAYFALGYDTWDEYVREELRMSPANSYQLLDTGHVMQELARAGVDLERTPPIPRRVVAKVKHRLPEARKVAAAALRKGEDPVGAIRELARRAEAAVDQPAGVADQGAAPTSGRTVTCPACHGAGRVSRSDGARLRARLK